jgi:pyruvate dehydrogenase E2 component (dihydrolipoamide acetyltransferase)
MDKPRRPRRRERIPPHELIPHDPMRQAIAARVIESMRTKPVFAVEADVDVSRLLEHRAQLKAAAAEGEIVPTVNDYVIKAAALTLWEHPRLNSWYADEGLRVLNDTNVGFAVGTEKGLVLPTILKADQKSLHEIATETREMAGLAREGKLRASLQLDAGFTVSNLGGLGIERFTAIISPPQTGILSVGVAKPTPVVEEGGIVVRPIMNCTLTVDHRVHDGEAAARWITTLREALSGNGEW